MKSRWLLILGIIVVLILVLLLIFFLLLRPSTTPPQNVPATNPFTSTLAPNETLNEFVQNCFTTYVSNYIAKNNAPSDSPKLDQFAQLCFTPGFISQWPSIANESDSDPVLLSQDYFPSWETTAAVSIASQASTTATAIVNLGSGSDTIQLIAQLQMTPSGWRISGVTSPTQQ